MVRELKWVTLKWQLINVSRPRSTLLLSSCGHAKSLPWFIDPIHSLHALHFILLGFMMITTAARELEYVILRHCLKPPTLFYFLCLTFSSNIFLLWLLHLKLAKISLDRKISPLKIICLFTVYLTWDSSFTRKLFFNKITAVKIFVTITGRMPGAGMALYISTFFC